MPKVVLPVHNINEHRDSPKPLPAQKEPDVIQQPKPA